jgi:GDP-4-dehydro-6-deoxy-D-mannose reductase
MLRRKRVLINGADGFTGRHLAKFLLKDASLKVYTGGSISEIQPDEVYQLRGSFTNKYDTDYASNVLSTKQILDDVLRTSAKTRVFVVGSSAEYGFPRNPDKAVKESEPLQPVSLYGLLKLFQTELMGAYIRLYGMDIVAVRPFNLFGRGMSSILFVGKMEQEIERYKRGEIREIVTGVLSVERDYIDVAEAVRHYSLVMEKGNTGEVYNVGSGKSVPLRDILKRMLRKAGLGMEIVRETKHETAGKIVVPKIFADISRVRNLSL